MTKKQKTDVIRFGGFGVAGLILALFAQPHIEKMTRKDGFGNETIGMMSYQQEQNRLNITNVATLGLGVVAGIATAGMTKLFK